MKIKFFKKENNFNKKNFTLNLDLYWEIAISCMVVMILGSLFFGYRLFMQINIEAVSSTTNDNGQLPVADENRIQKVLNIFSEREKKSIEIITSPAPITDPSL